MPVIERIRQNAARAYVRRRARETTREVCHCCGTLLETAHGDPLINYFVMDVQGHFYCINCDSRFEDGDERIYCEEEDE